MRQASEVGPPERMAQGHVTIMPIAGIPEVKPGADLAGILIEALEHSRLALCRRDILVVAQKIVSKAEGRIRDLAESEPSQEALRLAAKTGKDARLVEVILSECEDVLRVKENVIIVTHRLGHVMANAGIDRSNVDDETKTEPVLLLPEDPDQSAARLKAAFDRHFGTDVAVVISDSVGRAWRLGTVGVAIGVAGLPALIDRRGEPDLNARPLETTETGFADAVAASAVMVMGEAAEGTPAALVRGLDWTAAPLPATALLRPKAEDLFR